MPFSLSVAFYIPLIAPCLFNNDFKIFNTRTKGWTSTYFVVAVGLFFIAVDISQATLTKLPGSDISHWCY